MTSPLSQIPRPQASRFADKKKLFLVPNYVFPPDVPQDGQELLNRYWSEVRDSIANLERSLGAVSRVYHELIYLDGDPGLAQIDMMNPSAGPFIRAICQSTAQLHALEDAELVHEHTDWQRILTIGPASQKVMAAAIEGYQSTLETRYANIARKNFRRPLRRPIRRPLHPRRPPRPIPSRRPGLLRIPPRPRRPKTLARLLPVPTQPAIKSLPLDRGRLGWG